jgi:DNA-binding IclR family transcriptional regulator
MTEMANLLGISVSACSNIVKTMVELGYLRSLGPRQNYVIGDTPYFLARHGEFQQALISTARPLVQDLVDEINEEATLVVEHNGERCALLRVKDNNLLQVKWPTRLSGMSTCATGCVILSGRTTEERRNYWNSEDENCLHAKTFAEFNAACDKIARDKYLVLEPEEPDYLKKLQLSIAMGFPIFSNDDVIASLGLIVPMVRFTSEEDRSRILAAAQKTAADISDQLSDPTPNPGD